MTALLAVLCLAQLTTVLDNTILNLAVPAISGDLGTGTTGIQWIVGSYSLVQVGCLLAAGAAADRYGRRRLLQQGLMVFGAGSLAAAVSDSTGQLVAARAVMGVGGAVIGTATLAIALQVFEGAARTRAIGAWAAVSALGFALGPPVGGLILAHFGWQAVFLLNLPVVVIGLVGVRRMVPPGVGHGGPPDLVGAVLSMAGVTAIAGAFIALPDRGAGSAALLAVLGAALLVGFVRWEQRCPHPMLHLPMLRDRQLVGALSGIVLISFGSAGLLFLLSLQLQLIRSYAPLEAGVRLAPFALAIVLVSATGASARGLARLGRPAAIGLGMTCLAFGFAIVALSAEHDYELLLLGLLLSGAGCALANPALIDAVISAIPVSRAGTGAGLDGVTAEIGAGLGIAALGAVLSSYVDGSPTQAAHADLLSGLRTGQLLGALAVLLGGLVAAYLIQRAEAQMFGIEARHGG